MPTKAKRYCCKCSNYATQGNFCDDHAPQRNYKREHSQRENNLWTTWYKKQIWKDKRARQLSREPLCRECKKYGRYTKATEVDHIISHKGIWSLFIDDDNLQSLCKSCHSRKTARENPFFTKRWAE